MQGFSTGVDPMSTKISTNQRWRRIGCCASSNRLPTSRPRLFFRGLDDCGDLESQTETLLISDPLTGQTFAGINGSFRGVGIAVVKCYSL